MSLASTSGPIPRRMVLLASGTARNGAMGRPHAGGSKALEGRVGLHVSTSQAARARVQVHGRPCYPYHAIVMGTWWTPCRASARKVMPSGGSSCGHRGGGARPRASDDRRAPTYPTAIRGTAGERAGRRRSQHVSKRPEQDHQGSTGATARCAASAVSPGRLASAAPTTEIIGHRHRAGCRPSPIRVLPSRRDKE